MKNLTARQQQIYDLIKNSIKKTGMPPTRAEIAQQLGFRSPNAAEEHLKALARKGVIEMLSGTSRGLRLLVDNDDELPVIGKVAAGEPLLAVEHIESYYRVDPSLFKPTADFLLRVQGDSMKNVGIMDGDFVAIHKTTQVNNGHIVVARLEDEVTIKRLKIKGQTAYLIAENENYSPIEVNLQHTMLVIEGVVVGIIRSNYWM